MKMRWVSAVIFFLSLCARDGSAKNLTSTELLTKLYAQNPQVASIQAKADAEDAAIVSQYSFSNPRIGLMREKEMTRMQEDRGPMNSWSVSQEILFPTKYFSKGASQRAKARTAQEEVLDLKLEIRHQGFSLYYKYFSDFQILSLLMAQKETLREIARIAEAKRAAGTVPQQDEMKAHVEQTIIENELILQKQEVIETKATLNALLNQPQSPESDDIQIQKKDAPIPTIRLAEEDIEPMSLKNSKIISAQQFALDEAKTEKTLALTEYLPDFMVSYRKPYGSNAPSRAYSVNVEMTVPLWFLTQQRSEVSRASAKVIEAEKNLVKAKRQIESESNILFSKTQTLSKLLKIYETALIPQATSSLNSSRAAYGAGRIGFQELLEAERALYMVRIQYYQHLTRFVEALTNLERMVGASVSDLPFEGETL